MIYLDNGATSYPKPNIMQARMNDCISNYCGNPGRSGHRFSIKTGEAVYESRKRIGNFIGIDDCENLVFTKNTTEAINLALMGILKEDDNVVTSTMEHNSVLRPLKQLEEKGVTTSIVWADNQGRINPKKIKAAIKKETKVVVLTLASNVTGTIMDFREVGRICKEKKVLFLIDGAQGIGCMEFNMNTSNADLIAFPGHKGLLGPLGTGCLYVKDNVTLQPLLYGGTGTFSKDRIQHRSFPEDYEGGTVNAPGIIGLAHKTIGTYEKGAVRLSVGPFNTFKEINYAINAINKIMKR